MAAPAVIKTVIAYYFRASSKKKSVMQQSVPGRLFSSQTMVVLQSTFFCSILGLLNPQMQQGLCGRLWHDCVYCFRLVPCSSFLSVRHQTRRYLPSDLIPRYFRHLMATNLSFGAAVTTHISIAAKSDSGKCRQHSSGGKQSDELPSSEIPLML